MRNHRPLHVLLVACMLLLAIFMPNSGAQAQSVSKLAYVYNTNIPFATDFKTALELRGFSVALVPLGSAGSFDFTTVDAILIGDDTGALAGGWGGDRAAVAAIVNAERKTIGFGQGGSLFFGAIGVAPLAASLTFSDKSVSAVSPADAVWTTPNPIAIPPAGLVNLYGLTTPGLAVPESGGANPIGRIIVDLTRFLPIASTPVSGQFGTHCDILWGFRRQPSAMTVAGRDLLENIIRSDACASSGRPTDLRLTKTDSPDPATVGQNLTYTVKIDNIGKSPSPSTKVEDKLPAGTTYVSASPSQGSCYYIAGYVRCNVGTIAAGASATVTIVVKPTDDGTITNQATVLAGVDDLDPSNNTASQSTTVNQPSVFKPLFALPYKPVFTGPIQIFPTEDLSIHGIEMTQGIQCFDTSKGLSGCPDNSLHLVARKSTTARIYLKYSGPFGSKNNVPVRLVLIDANNVEYVVNATGKALPAIDQSSASNSVNIFFTVNFNSTVPVRYYAVVDPNGAYTETNESNNRFPTSGTLSINFTPSRTMKVLGQRLRYHPSGYTGGQYAGGWAVNGGGADWWEQVLPIRNNGIVYAVKSGYLNWTSDVTSSGGQHSLIQNLNGRWLLENIFPFFFGGEYTGARHVYGWVPSGAGIGGHADMPIYPHAGGLGIVGVGTDTAGTSTDNPGAGALIFGHELTHDYDVKHTDVSGDCGSTDSTSSFPYSSASIQEFGFNTITGKVYNPSNTHDLMSYCPAGGSKEGWISPYTWEYMWNKLRSVSSAEADTGRLNSPGAAVAVDVLVTNPALGPEMGIFNTVAKVDANVPIITPQPGDYAVELRDAGNNPIAGTHTSFVVSFESEYSGHTGDHPGDPSPTATAAAQMTIPWDDSAALIVILHGSTVIGSRTVSANAPSVTFTNPTTAQTWAAGTTQTVSWSGSDPDAGTTLTYMLFYSPDGITWDLIASNLTATSYEVQVDALAGSPVARFRVVANDGVLTGEDETNQPISVPNKAPEVVIMNPAPNSQTPIGDLLVFQGAGSDLEDGDLPDTALSWSSDKQGALGTGSVLPVSNMQPGLHRITLTVTDSNGVSSSATVSVFIGAQIELPLIVAP